MLWQVWADIAVGTAIPLPTAFLYVTKRIELKFVWLMVWGYRVYDSNPVWLTVGKPGYTVLPQLIWVVAPIVYYLGFIRINRRHEFRGSTSAPTS